MSDRLLGGACVALAAGMAWAAKDYAAPISYEPVGPRAFPLLLAALLATGGAWLVVRPGPGSAARLDGTQWRTVGVAAVAVVVYALLFERLGFPLTTALMSLPVGLAFGGRWRASLAGGVGLGLGLFLVFDKLLDVVLPSGVLSFLLGGR